LQGSDDCTVQTEAFVASFGMVAIAEMGDKTQFATIALGARYASLGMVVLGPLWG
jgi:putative Ca2+/H+ antiporter (TMEM165/GDT1 family)